MPETFSGRTILVVDDEALIVINLEQVIREAGGEPRSASTCAAALEIIGATHLDAVLLDVHLENESSYAVADELRRRGIPFAFLTGYLTIREGYEMTPFLAKPFEAEVVATTLGQLLDVPPAGPALEPETKV